MFKKYLKRLTAVSMAALLVFSLAGCGDGSSEKEETAGETREAAAEETGDEGEETAGGEKETQAAGGSGETYKIGLSNAYMGNDWRQIMCSVAEWTAVQEPYAGKIEFDIVQSDNTPEAQIASIQTMIDGGYDAILIDPSSTTALDSVISEAIDAGIVVVVFDQSVESDEPYKIQTDCEKRAQIGAEYIVEMLGGKGKASGNVIMDLGLSGASMAEQEYKVAKEILEAEPGINIVATYESSYEQGSTYTGVSSALTAADTIDAVWTQGPMTGVVQAFEDATKEVPIIVGGGYGVYNGDALTMLDGEYEGLVWLSGMPGMSALAIETAYKVLSGDDADVIKDNTINDLYLASNNTEITELEGVTINKLEEGVNCWRDQDASFGWPVVPTDFALQPEIADIFK